MACNEDLKKEGKPYPRTCQDCGIGKCTKYELAPTAGDKIWVLMPDYGYEGLREPVAAFRSEAEARSALELMQRNPAGCSMKLAEVELWPPALISDSSQPETRKE